MDYIFKLTLKVLSDVADLQIQNSHFLRSNLENWIKTFILFKTCQRYLYPIILLYVLNIFIYDKIINKMYSKKIYGLSNL